MGRRHHPTTKSHTLPSSPTHSSSSSDFEFTISISPRKSSATADELFYKGQLLPLHLSPRLSMVRTLLSSASTSSSSDTTTTASRSSTDSSTTSSARPSSATEDEEELKRLTSTTNQLKKPKYFTLAKLSSVFSNSNSSTNNNSSSSKDQQSNSNKDQSSSSSAVKRVSSTAKDVIRKYFNKVKPFYEKLSSKQRHAHAPDHTLDHPIQSEKDDLFDFPKEMSSITTSSNKASMSFSGNLRYPRSTRKSCISSCPSSMGSSPSHAKNGFTRAGSGSFSDKSSSMDELQSAIQGAIAHCKNSMSSSATIR